MGKFKSGDYVTSPRFRGIALYVYDNAVDMSNYDEDVYDLETKFYDDIYSCVMIGDDEPLIIHEDELELLSRDKFCVDCGQIGCLWHTMEEE